MANAFQTDAFQQSPEAFQEAGGAAPQFVDPGLIDQSGIVFSPARVFGSKVSPGLIDQSGITFSPARIFGSKVEPGLISQTGTVFSPTRIFGSKVEPGLISQAGVVFSPGDFEQSLTPGLISQAGVTFAPQFNLTVSPGLISHTGVTFSPQINLSISPGLISQTGVTFTPQVNLKTTHALLDYAGVTFAPTVIGAVVIGLIDQSGVTFSPIITQEDGAQFVTPSLIDQAGVTFAPTQINQSVSVGLISQPGTVFAPQVNQTVGGGHYGRDRFDRADGPIGTADSGQTWVDFEDGPATWSIVSNQAKITSTAGGNQATTTIDTGLRTVSVESVMTLFPDSGSGATDAGMVAALVDNSNYMLMVVNKNGNTHIYSRVAGSFTLLAAPNQGATYFDVPRKMRIDWNAVTGEFKVFGDGVLLTSFTVSAPTLAAVTAGTRQGIRQFGVTAPALFDNFFVSSAPMLPLIDQSGVVFAPVRAFVSRIYPALINQAGVVFTPDSVTGGIPPPPSLAAKFIKKMRRYKEKH